MGKKKTVTIDDSVTTPEEVKSEPVKKAFSISRPKIEAQPKPAKSPEPTESPQPAKKPKSTKSAQQPKQTKKTRSKKYSEKAVDIDPTQKYTLTEAITKAQAGSYTKFVGSLEAHINTNVKGVRGLVSMPYATGKKLTILAFGKGAVEAGADLEGNDEAIEQILKGKLNFDVLVTTPEWMPKLARTAKILGPRGLMPNPKNGTITDNLVKTITEIQAGKVEYRTEPNGTVIHIGIGKADQAVDEVAANLKALYNLVGKSKIKKITLAATMGPGVKVDLGSI